MRYLLHHLLQASSEEHPDRPAVVDGVRYLTYAELETGSNRLAHLLLDLGVARGDRVGLYLDKSVDSVVGIYGALKAGAVYVPFDPRAPVSRLAYIARNCGVRVLLTGREKAEAWAELVLGGAPLEALVAMNARDAEDLPAEPPRGARLLTADAMDGQADTPPARRTIDLDLAYILYTSGSTGEPKGVKLTHVNALTFVNWAAELCGVEPDDRLSSHAPLHFDLSVFDLFAAAWGGARVVLVPPGASVFPIEIARFIETARITVWYSVPSVLSMLAVRGNLRAGAFPRLRIILFAGEVFPVKYLRMLMSLLPHVRFVNLYGPTETNVCTYYEVSALEPDRTEPISVGKPIANVEVFAVTDEGRKAEPGEVGELYVRGPSVMQGYWGDAERTGRSLFPNPFGGELHDPVYRTGDLVRQDREGNYDLLGRRDSQVKSRGYRIELGEIETALYAHPSVVECAIAAIPDELVTNRIKAFVVVRDGLGAGELVRFCSERIPQYMIPESFEFRKSLPKTSTGKVDRQALSTASDRKS